MRNEKFWDNRHLAGKTFENTQLYLLVFTKDHHLSFMGL